MAGEALGSAQLGPLGIHGDRIIHVGDGRGRVITSRSHPRFLAHKGSINARGDVTVDGRLWNDPSVAADVAEIGGTGARLIQYEGAERFDVLPLLIATDGAIKAFGHDKRRLRPNIIIGDVDGMSETSWPGQSLIIGDVVIGIQDLRDRCIMTSYDPDTQVQDTSITRGIYQRFNGKLALNCFVIKGGVITVGDRVTLDRHRPA